MNDNASILEQLVKEDFGLKGSSNSRWATGVEHDSLVIDRKRGIFFFNSENIVGDPLVYLTDVRGMDFSSAVDYLKSMQYTGTVVYNLTKDGTDTVVYPPLIDVFHELGLNNRGYFYKRGITDRTIDRFQLGWYNDWYMIPIFMDGTLRNFQMRREEPSKMIKGYYRNMGTQLFNSDILKLVDEVYFVEGPTDAIILSQNGIPAISTDKSGVALPEWFSKFVNLKKIWVVFDNDTAGVEEAKRVAKVLGVDRCKIYNFSNFTEVKGYDPVDFFREGRDAEAFIRLVENSAKHLYELEDNTRIFKGKKR